MRDQALNLTRTQLFVLTASAVARMAGTALSAALGAVKRAYVVHRDGRILSGLSDQALKDIGISRGDIDNAVRFGRTS